MVYIQFANKSLLTAKCVETSMKRDEINEYNIINSTVVLFSLFPIHSFQVQS